MTTYSAARALVVPATEWRRVKQWVDPHAIGGLTGFQLRTEVYVHRREATRARLWCHLWRPGDGRIGHDIEFLASVAAVTIDLTHLVERAVRERQVSSLEATIRELADGDAGDDDPAA